VLGLNLHLDLHTSTHLYAEVDTWKYFAIFDVAAQIGKVHNNSKYHFFEFLTKYWYYFIFSKLGLYLVYIIRQVVK
jgi:hypothetical protein